jgi:5-methylcytosine-specific restriction protein B
VFTSDHFKLLNKWKGQRRDESNPEQDRACEDLKQACELTEAWADEVQKRLFPDGLVKVAKRPTSEDNVFLNYNSARIYPSHAAPDQLAYTVGIDAKAGFVVRIDTFSPDLALRSRYEDVRGAYGGLSPIEAILPAGEGLAKSFAELVEWSLDAIRGFKLRYDEVAARLQLSQALSDEDVLKHFDGKPAFKVFREAWLLQDKALFCRLARIVHSAGLDWWHMGNGIQVRFGRKSPGRERAVGVLGIVRGTRTRTISLMRNLGEVPTLSRVTLTEELVSRIESALPVEKEALGGWLVLETERSGLWPDQLREDPVEPGEDMSDIDEVAVDNDERIEAFNRIYYGPPGTGKTYQVSRLLKREYEKTMESVSSDEWRSQAIAEKIAVLKWWEGVAAALYDLGGRANVTQLLEHPFIRSISVAKGRSQGVRQTVWGSLQNHTVEESTTVKSQLRLGPAIFDKGPNSVWQFAGDWREECADLVQLVESLKAAPPLAGVVQRYSFVTFHQSYGYEEFVEGLRPVLDGEADLGEVRYEIRAGVFKELCRKARLAPDQRFAMVIDEINRGNISKILGELITLIEPDKREGAENAIAVTLPYSGESFSVPANVDIIGTMNTADRSLALLDTALRRRFDFVPVMPDTCDEPGAPLSGLRVTAGEKIIDIPKLLTAINIRVEALYDRDHTIGHAYMTALAKVPDGEMRLAALGQIFRNRIVPLLEEYFFEDWQKIRLVLADNQKDAAACFVTVSQDQEDALTGLFGGDHGLDAFATRRSFVLQEATFSNPDAYIGIYQTLVA